MTDEERGKFYRMEEKIDAVDKRVERLESKFDDFLELQESRHYELMTHSSAEASKVSVEFGQKLAETKRENGEALKDLDERKADKWTEWPIKTIAYVVGVAVLGAVGYAILHAYTVAK